MRLSVALLVLFAVNNASEEIKTTLRVDERVRILKENLKQQLHKNNAIKIQPVDDSLEFRSYEHDDSPVTPILESDERKADDKFKLRKLKTQPAPPSTSPWLKTIGRGAKNPKIRKTKNNSLRIRNHTPNSVATQLQVSKPVDIFYRKSYAYNIDMNEPIPWLHCSEMVSPYLAQVKKELTKPVVKTKDDHVVFRLLQLISMNTTDFAKEEIYSVLYQISKLKIRFFSWDVEAMKMLFNILTKDYPGQLHTFRSIKSGIKKLFDSWHLDTSNTTRLLLQSRVFRPPCIPKHHTGTLSTVIHTVNSYVLFSANLEDFKKLAQNLVPKNLAVKLTEFVSETSKRPDRGSEEQRKTAIDHEKPWKMDNENKYYERIEVQTARDKPTQITTTVESTFEPDRMHEKDYDRLEDTTYPEIVGKRYITVQRMPMTRDWFEEPPSFHKANHPNIGRSNTPRHSIYYKEAKDNIKPGSPERDINNNDERNKEKEIHKIGREEGRNGKQMMQYFPVENKFMQYKKHTKNETDRVRVNGRDISNMKQKIIKKMETKGKDDTIFDTVIMSKRKDSYEDYVTPKKDEDYLSDGIGPATKSRPIPSIQRGSRDGISSTIKSWPILSLQREDGRNDGIAPTSRKEPIWYVQTDLNDGTAPTIRERPNWSEETPDTRRPPIFSIKRQGTAKPTIPSEETFTNYIERQWMTTKRNTLPTENEWMFMKVDTTVKNRKTTEDYVLEDKPFDNQPANVEVNNEQVKARTESLLFDSKEFKDHQTSATRYTMKGTGIPTREYYKMSTPDYYKKLPRIVEKYDFNEPIPEADREREKYDDRFAQEPARVNKRMKQQQENAGSLKKQDQEKAGRLEKQHKKKAGRLEKQREERAGPLESILENIGFRFNG